MCLAAAAPEIEGELWTDESGELSPIGEAAVQLKLFADSLPELSEEDLGLLLSAHPDMATAPDGQVHEQIAELATALSVPFVAAARLVGRIPALWERPAAATIEQLSAMAAQLSVEVAAVVSLLISQPLVWGLAGSSWLIKDRLEGLATRIGVQLPTAVSMVSQQPLMWAIGPATVASNVKTISSALGLSVDAAVELVTRMPVLLTLEPKLLVLSVTGAAAETGLSEERITSLLVAHLGLVAVPSALLSAALYHVATSLEVEVEDAVDLMLRQPTLLCAQAGSIKASMEVLQWGLGLGSSGEALRLLAAQPALLYDFSREACSSRLEGLASTFDRTPAEVQELASQQPALLTLQPATLRSAVSTIRRQTGATSDNCLSLLVDDPATFCSFSHTEAVISSWAERLEIDPSLVSRLLRQQPGLLDATSNTVKARLESLAALFQIPADLAAQLLLRHPALAAVPPNATITRAKNLSTALGMSMQAAAQMLAKEPLLLALVGGAEAGGVRPYAQAIYDVNNTYEFYTTEWVSAVVKEAQPARMQGFSSIDSR